MRDYVLEETNWKRVRDGRFDVVVLPWGSTEAHNYHMPYGTDTMHAVAVAHEAARLATERGARVLVLPAIPFGVQTGQLDIPFCINLNPATQGIVLADIVESLEPHGVKAFVVMNGHGGNDFKSLIRELQPRTPIFLCTVNWWRSVNPSDFFTEPGDHAGELETSVIMHLAPDLVRLADAGPGAERKFRIAALREGWAWAPRQWTQVTDDTGVGDPRAATAAKGAAFMEAATARVADFLVELASSDPRDLYTSQ